MSKSSLCDYSDVYILLIVAITFTAQGAHTAAMQADRDNKQVILKNFALFTDCITETNNTKVDKGKDLDVVMSMYNLRNLGIIIHEQQEVYGNTKKMSQKNP